ncbi:hypothetical protein Q4E93_32545 [Flavitalea sp. BT771]|uniref:plasmid mobilization protein n=1 Tax=Flavitalea sp. BT771 TaxID=3063329 RepID=UPI0026E2EE8C|nr:hypothetical protein [Flavitalea sp. BT771]MDO6435391.1 hypothetical protein [Flavitalea sp. BT771]MDV6224249.1 hypothetical protein [Flavitalea sp. BT771]
MYASKTHRKSTYVMLRCTPTEKRYIKIRAREAGLSVSVFLRDMGLKDSPEKRKTLPPEVLAFIGVLSGIISVLEIIARKRLDNEDLDGLERAELMFRAKEVKQLIKDIKSYLLCSEPPAPEGQPD